MMKKLPSILVSIALLLGVLAAGCQPATEVEAPALGGVLDLYDIDPHTLDPAISGDMTSHEYIMQLFSGLVILDEDLEPAPDIAERWDMSDDGRTYTFYLRKDVKFHNGRGVNAADFKYSWERACSPSTGSQTADTYLGDIVGVKDVLAGTAGEIGGVRVIDDYTLEVTIDAPKAYFLSKLTYPTAYVVDSEDVARGADWWHKPNGTAWPSAYPGFVEAQVQVARFSREMVERGLAYLEPIWWDLTQAGLGTISQMKDGDYPHQDRGCFAYAPAVAEALRVYLLLRRQYGKDGQQEQGGEKALSAGGQSGR